MPTPDCPFCGHANPTAAKFCNECGSPLHLTPCGDCGAVNNLAEPCCWRCGKALLAHAAPPPVRQGGSDRGVPHELPTAEVLEQELVALEQEIQDLSRAPAASAREAKPVPEPKAPAAEISIAPDPPAAGGSAAMPVLDEVVEAPRRQPRRAITSVAVAGVVALAIGVGAYLYSLGRPLGSRVTESPPAPREAAPLPIPGLARDIAEPPRALSGPATEPPPQAGEATASPLTPGQGVTPPEARVVREVREAAALASRDAEPGPKAIDAPIEPRAAGAADEAPTAPVAAAALAPSCPPAVEAMALCEWVGGAKRE